MEYPLITVLIQNPYVLQMTPGYSATVTLTNTGLAETNRCENKQSSLHKHAIRYCKKLPPPQI